MSKKPKPIIGRYIDPMVDFAFKKLFGSEPNKDLLIAFLNEILKGLKIIVDLEYSKNDHPGDLKTEGGAVFDLLCTGDKGEKFLIEVQRGKQGRFKERMLFYAARIITDLAPKGDRANWAYDIPEVYVIALLEDFVLEGSTENEYLHDICLCDRNTGKIFYTKLGFTYIELTKFVKVDDELGTNLDKWLFALKQLPYLDTVPDNMRTPIFEKLFNIAEYTNLTRKEKAMYDNSLKYKWDNQNVVDTAVKEAVEEAVQRTREEDLLALREERRNAAVKLKKKGLPFDFIAEVTQLSIAEIENL